MKLTLFLIFLMVASFIYSFSLPDTESVLDAYGFSGKNLLERPYVLLTSIFLHGDLSHLLSNIFVLFFFGMGVEKEIGAVRMLLVFLAGAVMGDLLSLLVYSFDSVAIGASAGIFAVVGAGILVAPFDLSFYPYIMPVPLGFLGVMYALYNAYGFVAEPASKISYIAHFGGLFAGLFYGFRRQGIKKSLTTIAIIVFLMILLPVIWMLMR